LLSGKYRVLLRQDESAALSAEAVVVFNDDLPASRPPRKFTVPLLIPRTAAPQYVHRSLCPALCLFLSRCFVTDRWLVE
jgi:hypothetical protein